MVCLETTFVIDALRAVPSAATRLRQLVTSADTVSIAAPTLFEVMEGIARARSTRERDRIQEILRHATILPLDAESASAAGHIRATLIADGEMIGHLDAMIGAIALVHGETLLTKNTKHFSRIPDLAIETY